MLLHEDKGLFMELVNITSVQKQCSREIIEKDYYVSMILKLINEQFPSMVFKGGTALSKCYKLVKRFSEDIDIAVDEEFSQGKRKQFKKTLTQIFEILGLQFENEATTRSRRDFNRYIASFPSLTRENDSVLKPKIYLETYFAIQSYPICRMKVSSIIGETIKEQEPSILEEYSLTPFEMKVQSLERAFIDKLFALCDYYLDGNCAGHSRHIYDLYKLLPHIDIDTLKPLLVAVRSSRLVNDKALSARQEVNITEILQQIVSEKAYKNDYNTITANILWEKVKYSEAITVLEKIMGSSLLK